MNLLTHFFSFLLLWSSVVFVADAQTINWQKSFGGSANDSATAVLAVADGYIIAGNTFSADGDVGSNNSNSLDVWLAKLTTTGTLAWKKSISGSRFDHVHAITAGPDGTFVITGTTHSVDGDMAGFNLMYGGYYSFLWLMKFSSTGELIWKQYVDSGRWNAAYAIMPDVFGQDGYLVAGSYYCGGCQSGNDFYTNVFDQSGNRTGIGTWPGGRGDDQAYGLTPAPAGGYLAVGKGSSPTFLWDSSTPSANNRGGYDVWLKRSGLNSYYWLKSFGGSGDDIAYATVATGDGGFVIAGYTSSTDGDVTGSHGGKDAWVLKVNKEGNLVWQKTLGGSGDDIATAMIITPAGDLLIAGTTASTNGDVQGNHGGTDGWVVKLTGAGDIVWQKTLGGSGDEGFLAIAQAPNGQYVLTGYAGPADGDVQGNHGQSDMWVVTLSDIPLRLLPPGYDCATGKLTFNTTGGNGFPVQFMAIGVTAWTTSTTATIETGVRLDPNSQPITVFARQNDRIISRVFDYKTICNGGNQAPVFTGVIPELATQVGQPFAYTLNPSLVTDPEGGTLTLTATGLPQGLTLSGGVFSGTAIRSGRFSVTLTATDPQGASASLPVTIQVLPEAGAAPLLLLDPLYNCATGQLTFRTSGGNGSPVQFMAVGVTPWTDNPVQALDDAVRLDPNSQPVTLFARQNDVFVSRRFDFRNYCSGAARRPSSLEERLTVTVLENPVHDKQTVFDINGAAGQPVMVRIVTMEGQVVSQQQIERASVQQRVTLPVGNAPGIYLLQVQTPDRQLSVRILTR
nr:putative Ig domain-containing protein [uncultured Arsenicibacter sp.]